MKYCFSILIVFISFCSYSQQETSISQRLQKAIAEDVDKFQNISILLADRFDIVKLDNELNGRKASLHERVKIVKQSLQDKANAVQPAFIAYLKSLPSVDAASVKPLWITNMLFCRIKGSEIKQLVKRTDIEFMDINAELQLSAVKDQLNLPLFFKPDGAEPGLKAVNADKLWALGYSGYGRVAYVADTGIDPTHPAFSNKTRSLYVPQAQTWYDFKGGITPYNCGVHGSHVLGTILGLDRLKSDTVGVAFNAQWIGGAILCGVGTQDNLEGLQWAIDPDGDPNTISDMPDIINNSWYDPDITDDCSSGYIDVEAALEAAGIASIFSAGNAGPNDQTITPPHNININLVNSFTVAAVNGNNPTYPIADFSSRGPSKCGGTGSLLIKPEVAAPGLNVRSCSYNKDYELLSGTSMASPHTCGTILLLKEAFPYLSGYDLKMALYNSCTDLGDPGEDNTYGMGLINGWAAYNYLIEIGNVPVDPTVNRDMILIEVETKAYQCEKTLQAKAYIENAGKDDVTEFLLNYTITDEKGVVLNYQQEWTGVLIHGQRLELDINPVNVSPGRSIILYEITKVNNDVDQRPLNNRVKKEPVIIDSPYQTVSLLAGTNVSTCNGTQVLLESSFNLEGRVDWFDENGNKIGSGNPFLVPPSKKANTYTMQPVRFAKVGKVQYDGTPLEDNTLPISGLVFNADYPFILKTVKIYNTSKGIRKIRYADANGVKLEEKTLALTNIGEQVISLNYPIVAGVNQRLILTDDSKPLAVSKTDVSFPYSVQNVVSIIGSKDNNTSYSYFYDWHIEFNDFCGKVDITVPYLPSPDTLNAGFTAPDSATIVQGLGAQVSFVDTSFNASNWYWSFGDGDFSSMQNPTHTYLTAGTYNVAATVNNSTGCYDTEIKKIVISPDKKVGTINQLSDNSFKLFPNPNTGKFVIKSNSLINSEVRVNIYNSIGKEVMKQEFIAGEDEYYISLTKQVPGVYWVRLSYANQNFVTSVIIE